MLDTNIVNVALPSIGTGLRAQPAQLQWVVSAYFLGFGLVPIIAGRLGDDRGRKKMLVIGITGFVTMSALIGLAPDPNVLIGARLIQGLAAGLLNPQISGIIQNIFPRYERARAFSLLGVVIGAGSASGPVLGGLIIYVCGPHLGWRVAFLINVPVGIAALVLIARWLPPIPRTGTVRPLDLPGATLIALALVAVLFPAVEYDSSRDFRLAYLFIPAALLFAAFLWWEAGPGRRRGYPLIDVGLFRIRTFADGCTLALTYFGCMAALPLLLTLFLQQGLHYTPLHAAAIASVTAVCVAGSALFAGRMLPRYGARVLVVALTVQLVGIGSLILVISLVGGSFSPDTIGLLVLVPLAIVGLGVGGISTTNQVLTFADVDAAQGSTAGGMLQSAQRIGLAIGSAIASAVYYTVALAGKSTDGRAHQTRYAHAYLAGLSFVSLLVIGSLFIAIRTLHHRSMAAQSNS